MPEIWELEYFGYQERFLRVQPPSPELKASVQNWLIIHLRPGLGVLTGS